MLNRKKVIDKDRNGETPWIVGNIHNKKKDFRVLSETTGHL